MLFTSNDYAPVAGLPPHRYCCFCLDQALGVESAGLFRLNACGHIFHRECLEEVDRPDTHIPCVMCFTYRLDSNARPVVRTSLRVRRERAARALQHSRPVEGIESIPRGFDEERGPRLSTTNYGAVGFVAPAEVAPPTITPYQSATDPCPVCMDPMRDTSVLLQCNHRFHASCLLGQRKCPLCRNDAGFPTRDALNNAVYAESAGLREEVQKLIGSANPDQ
jgi:hypothetical protein